MIIIECPVRLFYRSSPKRHLTTKKTQTDNFFVPWPAIQSFRHKNHTAQWSSSVLIDTTLINASRLPVQTKLIIVVLPSDLTLVTPPLVLSSWYRQVHGPLLVGLFFLTREIPRVLCPTLSSVAALWLFSKPCFIFFRPVQPGFGSTPAWNMRAASAKFASHYRFATSVPDSSHPVSAPFSCSWIFQLEQQRGWTKFACPNPWPTWMSAGFYVFSRCKTFTSGSCQLQTSSSQ